MFHILIILQVYVKQFLEIHYWQPTSAIGHENDKKPFECSSTEQNWFLYCT